MILLFSMSELMMALTYMVEMREAGEILKTQESRAGDGETALEASPPQTNQENTQRSAPRATKAH
jgi:hypothetical protein